LGAEAPIPCDLGTLSNEGSASCTPCPAGTHREYNDNTMPWGFFCEPCSAGYTSLVGSEECSMCAPGTYSSSTGASSCTPCDAGTYGPTAGRVSACPECLAGTYQPEAGKTTCLGCLAGESTPAGSSDACSPCAPGTYKIEEGAGACQSCPAGETQSLPGQTYCYDCGPGYYTPPGQSSCAPTPCTTCAAGFYVLPATVCSTGSTTVDQSCAECAPASCPAGKRLINSCPGNGSLSLRACGDVPQANFGINCDNGWYVGSDTIASSVGSGALSIVAIPPQLGGDAWVSDAGNNGERGYVVTRATFAPVTVNGTTGPTAVIHISFGVYPWGSTSGPPLFVIDDTNRAWMAQGPTWDVPTLISSQGPLENPALAVGSVSCAALPFDPAAVGGAPGRLVCGYAEESTQYGYLVSISTAGARSAPLHTRNGPQITVGVMYDHVTNTLYWSTIQYSPGVSKRVWVVPLTASYDPQVGPEGEPTLALSGFTLIGGSVDPATGWIYFFHQVATGDGWAILHRWRRSSGAPPTALGSVGASRGVTSISFVGGPIPLTSVDVKGTIRVVWRDAATSTLKILTPTACEACSGGRTSPGLASGPDDCYCAGSTFWNGASCQAYKTNCGGGMYISAPGNHTSDITCAPCLACAPGQYMDSGCDGTGTSRESRVCAACEPCLLNQHIVASPGMCDGTGTLNRDTGDPSTCAACALCADLEYIAARCPGSGTTDTRQCAGCTLEGTELTGGCGNGKYITDERCDGAGDFPYFQCDDCVMCGPEQSPTPAAECDGTTRSPDQVPSQFPILTAHCELRQFQCDPPPS
jgi:hypothetical protein